LPPELVPPRDCPPLASVSIAPYDHLDDVRDRLLDDLIRILHTQDWMNDDIAPWRDLYRKPVEALYTGSPCDLAEAGAPTAPLGACVWRLADDSETYGEQAGWFLVVDGSLNTEVAGSFATEAEAQAVADRLNADDPFDGCWYRHWFRISNCCDGDYIPW